MLELNVPGEVWGLEKENTASLAHSSVEFYGPGWKMESGSALCKVDIQDQCKISLTLLAPQWAPQPAVWTWLYKYGNGTPTGKETQPKLPAKLMQETIPCVCVLCVCCVCCVCVCVMFGFRSTVRLCCFLSSVNFFLPFPVLLKLFEHYFWLYLFVLYIFTYICKLSIRLLPASDHF